MPHAVIAGAGLAGLRAAETLRRRGFDGEITVVGDEPHRPYNRPPLSKEVLLGAAAPESCLLSDGDLGAAWLLGRTASGLDVRRKALALDGGDELRYDKLVIATGCRPRPWPQPLDLDGVRTLRTLDDAIWLRDAVRAGEHATIVGAGFLGCEVAATLRARGVAVSLIDVAAHPMPGLGPEIGGRVARLHAAHDVDLRLGVTVTSFDGTARVEAVHLSDGASIATDLVLVAMGALPNTEWLAGSGLVLHDGAVLCDEHCFVVGARDVAVAGDVAAWPHPTAGGVIRVEHWTNAAEMAIRAATNLVTPEPRPHRPVLTFWSDQYDVKIRAAGLIGAVTDWTVVDDVPEQGQLVVDGHRAGRLVGAVTFNSAPEHLRHRRELAAVG